jgi:tripartite-type tricarboxylate transporter receptor subunit TctC
MIVPFPAGGSPDLIARYLSERMAATLEQGVVIENKAGASGSMGTMQTAQSPADGYTLVMASTGPLTVNPAVQPSASFDPLSDLEPVILIGKSALVLMLSNSVPARDMNELLALARQQPGKLTYGSAGAGNLTNLVGELLKMHAKVNILHVPYKGTAALKPDLFAGRVSMFFDTVPAAIPLVRAGQVRAIGVTTRERTSAAPELPSFAELGVDPNFDVSGWFAVMAPKGTPAPVVARLNATINDILHTSDAKARFAGWGIDVVGGRPEVVRTLMVTETARWKEVVRVAGIKAD